MGTGGNLPAPCGHCRTTWQVIRRSAGGGSIPRAERGAIHMEASHWRISGLEIVNGPYGIHCDGCNGNVFSRISTHDNYESGFQLQGSSSDNRILNLDSHGNRDPRKNGESADGLAVKEGSGTGNVVRGARLWNNVDDGFDAWKFASPILIENTISYGNGYNRWNFPDFAGDGNGFKMGGGSPAPAVGHALRNSIAFRNAAHGVTDNGNPGKLALTRDTTWANAGTGFDADTSGAAATLTANTSVADARAAAVGTGTVSSVNSWNLGGTWDGSSVLSTDPPPLIGPRAADGTLPQARPSSCRGTARPSAPASDPRTGSSAGFPLRARFGQSDRKTRFAGGRNAPPGGDNSPRRLIVQRGR